MNLRLANKDSFDRLAENIGEMFDCMLQKSYVGFRPSKDWEPPINVYEAPSAMIVCVELAGMRREKIDVQVMPGRLTIRGMRPDPRPPGHTGPFRVHLLEIHRGLFARTIELSDDLDIDGAQAQYKNGYLWIRLPK